MKKSAIIDLILTVLLASAFIIILAMRDSLSRQLFISSMFVLVDVYALIGLLSLMSDQRSKWIVAGTYILISLYGYYGMFVAFERWRTDPGVASPVHNFTIGFAFTLLVTKFVFVLGLVLQDIGRMIFGLGQGVASLFMDFASESGFPSRRRFITAAATGIASVPFLGMLYGITFGKYNYVVEHVKLNFSELPKSFNGLRIVQISDAHAGSWDSVESVNEGIKKINELKPDIVVFTGDLVNGNKNEIDPFIPVFSKISAKYGKYAVLGNHDYYGTPRDPLEREDYWKDFYDKYKSMGFDLIMNDNRTISNESESFKLLGVENWGAGRWFPKKGDLDQACVGCSDDDFCVLLSHDPTHFDEHVVNHRKKIHLTLSGHTHGMQFGIKFKDFKWSPVQYRYKKWMGLYEEKDQLLYVNRGFGFLGFPGRVGMWPEITCFELYS